jgi:hypothetical protein
MSPSHRSSLSPDAVTIVFHDGFRIREWEGFFTSPEFERIVVDTHLYLMEYTLRTGDGDLYEYLRHIRNEFGPTVREMSPEFPLIVGEWCLEPMSAKAAAMPRRSASISIARCLQPERVRCRGP